MTEQLSTEQLLEMRGKTHGLFSDNAEIFEAIFGTMTSAQTWDKLKPAQRLALAMIALKIGRLLSEGAPIDADEPWNDMAGYAKLGAKAC